MEMSNLMLSKFDHTAPSGAWIKFAVMGMSNLMLSKFYHTTPSGAWIKFRIKCTLLTDYGVLE